MPLLGSRGAGSAKGFGFAGGAGPNPCIQATGGTITEVVILKFIHLQDQELLQFKRGYPT
jgi:hypothetical protein